MATVPAVSGSYREGKQGETIRGVWGFQIEAEEERGRPVPRGLRRAEAAELELDLELGGSGEELGVQGEGLVV